MLLATSAILIGRPDVLDESSANFASITELVFLRMILQHTGESPEEIAIASLSQIQVHGPKIRMLPGQIISLKLKTHGAGEDEAGCYNPYSMSITVGKVIY